MSRCAAEIFDGKLRRGGIRGRNSDSACYFSGPPTPGWRNWGCAGIRELAARTRGTARADGRVEHPEIPVRRAYCCAAHGDVAVRADGTDGGTRAAAAAAHSRGRTAFSCFYCATCILHPNRVTAGLRDDARVKNGGEYQGPMIGRAPETVAAGAKARVARAPARPRSDALRTVRPAPWVPSTIPLNFLRHPVTSLFPRTRHAFSLARSGGGDAHRTSVLRDPVDNR